MRHRVAWAASSLAASVPRLTAVRRAGDPQPLPAPGWFEDEINIQWLAGRPTWVLGSCPVTDEVVIKDGVRRMSSHHCASPGGLKLAAVERF